MAKLIYETEIIDPQSEERWLARPQDVQDLQRHISYGKNNPQNWEGFSWALLGGGLSFLVSIVSYHLFEQAPEKNILILGYSFAIFLLLTSSLLILRNNSEPPSFLFHQQEAVRILNRISAENQSQKDSDIQPHKIEEDLDGQLEDNLKTDFSKSTTKLFKE